MIAAHPGCSAFSKTFHKLRMLNRKKVAVKNQYPAPSCEVSEGTSVLAINKDAPVIYSESSFTFTIGNLCVSATAGLR